MTKDDFLKMLPDLLKDYQPLPEIKSRIANVDLLMVVGATGVGKTSIIKRLNIPFVITDTTRPIRPDEIDGSDYNFRSDYDQIVAEIKARKFVQVNIFPTGDFYGTKASAYPELGFADYAIVADRIDEFRKMGFNETITAYITPPNFLEWMGRIDRHNSESDQLAQRLDEAKRSFSFALNDKDTHFILNDDLDMAVHQTETLLNGKADQNREAAARQAAEQIFKELTFA